jgi:hypothetical protein
MYLVGKANSSPVLCPVPLANCADASLDAFRIISSVNVLNGIRGSLLLSERAAINGYPRRGVVSPETSCRILPSSDGWIGLNLARSEDWELLPAWLRDDFTGDWPALARQLTTRKTAELVQRGRLLGIAVADATTVPKGRTAWYQLRHRSHSAQCRRSAPRVLDLSSLWAGPLCSHLWQRAGAEVIKVESTRRPDGARAGSQAFFELLNQGKQSLMLDLHTSDGQQALKRLIGQVDIVLEASRPRALRQMGIIAEDCIDANPGLTWVSITGYGRQEPQTHWIAYGDDAGVAAGLSAILHQVTGEWLICGDAIADPLTGMHAALAGWASWLSGGGNLLELSLEQTVRYCITANAPADNDYRARYARWSRYLKENHIVPRVPQRRGEGTSAAP